MIHIITNLLNQFKRGTIHLRLIFINVSIFFLFAVLGLLGWLFRSDWSLWLTGYFSLPSSLISLEHQPWSLVTYMFVHQGIWHLVFNMFCLYWFGELFLQFFSARHLRGLYIFGGLVGGVTFILAYNLFPIFQVQIGGSSLVGASAAIMAIMVALAFEAPEYPINLLFIGNVKMKYIAGAIVLISVLSVSGNNSGGEFAHLGGALAGWLFTRLLHKGHDIVAWINVVFDFFNYLFSPSKWYRKRPKKKIYSAKEPKDWDFNARKKNRNDEVDKILEKLKRSGYDSLTIEEKKKLFDASK